MKSNVKLLILVLTLLLAAVFMTSCGDDGNPYSGYDAEGYNVSVKYDANGGLFTTNTSVVVDTYDATDFPTNGNGEHELVLVSPDNPIKDKENRFTPYKPGYFLVGWYTEREEVKSPDGSVTEYRYSGRWDFDNDRFAVSADGKSADTPSLTLYAAWAPQFSYEFYDLDSGAHIGSYEFDPVYIDSIRVPAWNTETGKLNLYEFPSVDNKTFNAVYLDAEGTQLVTAERIAHTGDINLDNAVAENPVMNLYVDMLDGAWFNIYKAEHFVDNSILDGNYNILADLDFTGLFWSNALTYGEFTGTIIGNGHKFSNINVRQTSASRTNAGVFGTIADSAKIENVEFENVTFNLEVGSRMPGASFGLLAGAIADVSSLSGVTVSGKIIITPTPLITEDTVIGLLCGSGDIGDFDISNISCEALEPEDEYTDAISVSIDGNDVNITVIPTVTE